MKTNKLLLAFFVLMGLGLAGYLYISLDSEELEEGNIISNFEECINAGNPVMESYPRQCRHDGVTYREEIAGEIVADSAPILTENETILNPPDKTVTSADDAPLGSIHNLPVPDAVSAVRKRVANDLGVREGIVIVLSSYEKTWTNGCLDLEEEGEMCTEALVQGYEVTVQASGQEYIYHTNSDGSVLRKKKNKGTTLSFPCSDEQRKAEVCEQDDKPVCAKVNIQCITTPCDPIEETFSNVCEACKNQLVESWKDGEC